MTVSSASLARSFEDDAKNGLIFRQQFNDYLIGYIVSISHTKIDNISELVIECQSKLLMKNLEKRNDYDRGQGFLIHEWTRDSLTKSLSSSGSFLICIIDSYKNHLAGYLLVTATHHLFQHVNSELGQLTLDENVLTDQQWKQFISSHVHYIEQTGVDPEYQRLGIGNRLITLAKNQSTEGLYTCVIVWPYENTASTNLKRKNGFQSVGIWSQINCSESFPHKATVFIWPPIQLTHQSH